MRILILDHKKLRFDAFEKVIKAVQPDADIRTCASARDFTDAERADFDFIALHFAVGRADEGNFAFAFLDGLFGRTADEPPRDNNAGKLAGGYYDLGLRIRDSWKEPPVLVYSGGGLAEYRSKLTSYGQRVGMSEGEIGEEKIFDRLANDLTRALKNGRVDIEVFGWDEGSYSFLPALLLLCQGYLAVHFNVALVQSESEQRKEMSIPGDLAESLELMTGHPLVEAVDTLSENLPPTLKTRKGLDRLREQTCAASWWQVIARRDLSARVKAELWQGGAQEPQLGAIEPLLKLIETEQPIGDVALVARAYNAAVGLMAGGTPVRQ